MVASTACLELEHFEITANKGRCINEYVVVRAIVTVTLLFQARINLPSRRSVVFHAARHMFLTDNVHKNRRWRDVRHLIVQQSRKNLITHRHVVSSWFGDAPCLLVGLLPIQGLVASVHSTEILNVACVV